MSLAPLLLLLGCAVPDRASAQPEAPEPARPVASGVVFEDSNGNRRRDPGERGVPGVAVSNGEAVVQTDAQGRYRLPVSDGTIIFLSKPSGYMVPLDEANLPRFYYIHAPQGTPAELGLRFAGVAPSGPLPESVDFPLVRAPEPAEFEVVWFADTQAQTPAELDYLREDVISELVGTDAAFGITAGDVVYDDLSLYPRHNRLVGAIGIPWFNLPGNHDLNFLAPDDRTSLETYKRHFGPPYYSFDYGRVHFVLLDSVDYHGRNAGRERPNAWGAGVYEGRIGEPQLTWLANDLALVPQDRLVVVAMHIQLRTPGPDNASINVSDREALLKVLSGRRVFSVAGHHQRVLHQYFGPADGFQGPEPLHQHVLAAVSGGWWSGPRDVRGIAAAYGPDGTPNGYYIMSVRGTEASMRYKAAGAPAAHQMRISVAPVFEHSTLGPAAPQGFHDPPIARERLAAMELVVNLFDGGPNSRVSYRVDDGPAVPMARAPRVDPLLVKLRLSIRDKNVFWTPTDPTGHIWAAPLPRDLAPGVHRITVEAIDEYGRAHTGRKLIEVE